MVIQEEMMMKKYTLSILAIVILASACREEALEPEQQKGEIVLSAFTSYTQDELSTKGPGEEFFEVATKTFFSGKDENDNNVTTNSTKERIDWQEGDKIYVNMLYGSTPAGTAVYTVGGYRTASDKSVSETTSLISGSGLTSQGNGEHTFLSTYPAGGGDSPIGPIGNNGNFTLKMPEGNLGFTVTEEGKKYVVRDNMDYAFMVGRTKSSDLSNVKMRLQPYFNAYQFIIGEAPQDYNLTQIKLTSSNYLRTKGGNTVTGGVNASGNREALSGANDSNCSKEIICDLTKIQGYSNGIPLDHTDGSIDITLLALPLTQGDLSVEFTFKLRNSNQTIKKTLNLTGKTLNPYHKLRVENIGGANWVYVLEVVDVAKHSLNAGVDQTSYKVISYRKKNNRVERVKWRTEVNISSDRDNPLNANWVTYGQYNPASFNISNSPAGWIDLVSTANSTGVGSSTETEKSAEKFLKSSVHNAVTISPSNEEEYHQLAIGSHTHPSGINNLVSKSSAIDLSMYSVEGLALPGRSTANCYVVNGSGWYKIPLVYGNAFKNGSNILSPDGKFTDHTGAMITKPWIQPQTGIAYSNMTAEIVWQDYYKESLSQGLVKNLEVTLDGYLVFFVPQQSISPGNAVIAVKSGSNILWSWHIWLTDQHIKTENGFLNASLGWVSLGAKQAQFRPARGELLRVIQVDDSGNYRTDEGGQSYEFNIVQKGSDLFGERQYRIGRYLYYQYGRKDPMFPATLKGNSSNVIEPIYDGSGNQIAGAGKRYPSNMPGEEMSEIKTTIAKPGTFNISNGRLVSIFVDGHWSSSSKTLYDPSPVGYRVMPDVNSFVSLYKNPDPSNYNTTYFWAYEGTGWQYWYPGTYLKRVSDQSSYFIASQAHYNDDGEMQKTTIISDLGKDTRQAAAYYWAANGQRMKIEFSYGPRYVIDNSPNKYEAYGVLPVAE